MISQPTILTRYRGINQWDEKWISGYYNATTGVLVPSAGSTTLACKNKIKVVPSTTYYVVMPSGLYFNYFKYDKNSNFLGGVQSAETGSRAITIDANTEYIAFHIDSYGTSYNDDVSINYPSTEHDYHPANLETFTVTKDVSGGRNIATYLSANVPNLDDVKSMTLIDDVTVGREVLTINIFNKLATGYMLGVRSTLDMQNVESGISVSSSNNLNLKSGKTYVVIR